MKNVIKDLPKGSAPGPCGWRPEFVKGLVADDTIRPSFLRVLDAIASGDMPLAAHDSLRSCTLVGLWKPKGGIRPIAIGEVFLRIVESSLVKQEEATLVETLGHDQYGVAVRGGAEAIPIAVNSLLSLEGTRVCVKIDCKNAFNTICRNRLFECVRQFVPSWFPLVKMLYTVWLAITASSSGETDYSCTAVV